MPVYTDEELDSFAKAVDQERNEKERKSTETLDSSMSEAVMDEDEDIEMKQEAGSDTQIVPADEDGTPVSDFRSTAEDEDQNEAVDTPRDEAESEPERLDGTDEAVGDLSMHDASEGPVIKDDSSVSEDDGTEAAKATSSDSESDDDIERSSVSEEGHNKEEDEDDSESDSGSESSDGDERDEDDEQISELKICSICKAEEDTGREQTFLTCNKCGTHVHEECAGDDEVMKHDEIAPWRCQNCLQALASESPTETLKRNRNSAPRLVRDLLPVSRGVQKPNSHSIFNQPLISEGDDGGRSLRKRKSPTAEPQLSEKRRRRATPKAISASLQQDSKVEPMVHSTRRASQKVVPAARILQYRPYEKAPPHKFILAFRLDQSKIEKVLNKPSRPGRRRDRRRPPKIPPPPVYQPPVPKFPALPTTHLIFPSMWGDRENDANAKPYGGILTDTEADTSRSLPQLRDRELFEIARKEAEEERRKTSAAAEIDIDANTKLSKTVSGPPSKIKFVQLGRHLIDTFYAAPYPEEYSHESRLFICEFCLKYLPSEFVAWRHKLKCPAKHPPGDEIYRDETVSIWEVDGRKKTEYCQCLCLMAKMFLGSKTLYYDVEPFLFYILTEYDEFGYHFVGYFSKEKRPASQNNVSCILVLPIHQRKGYATFLIDFSYLLTRIEGKDGSPEKPLSDMGLTAYRSYWDLTMAKLLLEIGTTPFSVKDLMQRTGMTADDVVHSLERLYAFIRDPVTKIYAVRYDRKLYETIVSENETKKHRKMKPDNLIWTPYIMGRSDQAHLDTQPVQTIAPREGDDVLIEQPDSPSKQEDTQKEQTKHLSPSISHEPTNKSSATDPLLVNGAGHVAPGPPSAQLLTGHTNDDTSRVEPKVNGLEDEAEESATLPDDDLSGYALAYRTHKVPPNRFQIDPPIPASMLRARSHKKRNPASARTMLNGDAAQTPSNIPVRSSPRHVASVNGSVNGGSGLLSPEKPSTPIRRSNRKSGLANMEVAALDGSVDEDDEDEPDIGDEIEAKLDLDDEESASDNSSEEGDGDAGSTGQDDEDEDVEEVDDGEDDEDAEIPDDDEEESEEDEVEEEASDADIAVETGESSEDE